MKALPRFKLSNDVGFFNELVGILKSLPITAQDELWQLLAFLRTNPSTYSHLLGSESVAELAKRSSNVVELLYSLQVVE